jgi:beta-glucanase (GH16 family)
VTGGVSVRDAWAQKCGRYDVRFWMDPGKGIAYALPLWPQANHYPPEVDFAEDNGQDRRTNYSSVHAPDGRKPINRSVRGDFTQWHTIGLEWTPGNLLFTLDGKEWATVTGSAVPIEPMTLALQSQAWYCGHNWEACPDASTPARVNLTIDWAVAYAWTG